MSFTTPCFIRKNTPELREELKAIGYVASTLYSPKERYLMAFRAGLYDSTDITDHLSRIKGLEYIDCGENEELFLTIAALNDTSDHDNGLQMVKTGLCITTVLFPDLSSLVCLIVST